MSSVQLSSTDSGTSTVTPISAPGRWQNIRRTTEFWTRAGNVYAKYKVAQVGIGRPYFATFHRYLQAERRTSVLNCPQRVSKVKIQFSRLSPLIVCAYTPTRIIYGYDFSC